MGTPALGLRDPVEFRVRESQHSRIGNQGQSTMQTTGVMQTEKTYTADDSRRSALGEEQTRSTAQNSVSSCQSPNASSGDPVYRDPELQQPTSGLKPQPLVVDSTVNEADRTMAEVQSMEQMIVSFDRMKHTFYEHVAQVERMAKWYGCDETRRSVALASYSFLLDTTICQCDYLLLVGASRDQLDPREPSYIYLASLQDRWTESVRTEQRFKALGQRRYDPLVSQMQALLKMQGEQESIKERLKQLEALSIETLASCSVIEATRRKNKLSEHFKDERWVNYKAEVSEVGGVIRIPCTPPKGCMAPPNSPSAPDCLTAKSASSPRDGPSPRGASYVEVALDGVREHFLIDTGSPITVMHMQYYLSLPKEGRPTLLASRGQYRTANGKRLRKYGEAIFHLVIGGGNIMVQRILVADIEDAGILGHDFLVSQNCLLDLARGNMTMHGRTVKLKGMPLRLYGATVETISE